MEEGSAQKVGFINSELKKQDLWILRRRWLHGNEIFSIHSLLFYKNIVFPAHAEYSYFSADFRLKIFLLYS